MNEDKKRKLSTTDLQTKEANYKQIKCGNELTIRAHYLKHWHISEPNICHECKCDVLLGSDVALKRGIVENTINQDNNGNGDTVGNISALKMKKTTTINQCVNEQVIELSNTTQTLSTTQHSTGNNSKSKITYEDTFDYKNDTITFVRTIGRTKYNFFYNNCSYNVYNGNKEQDAVWYIESKIPYSGNGVQANTIFKKGQFITRYEGNVVHPNFALNNGYTFQFYTENNSKMSINGLTMPKYGRGLGSFVQRHMNHITIGNKTPFKTNCRIYSFKPLCSDPQLLYVGIFALRDIEKGEELYTEYGHGYIIKISKETKLALLNL